MDTVFETHGLTKRFGKIVAVNQLDLAIPRGTVYGILGPNGSGKTTTLGMALSVIRPSDGSCSWFGQPVSTSTLKRVGAILEAPLFYPYLSGENNLKVLARIKDVPFKRINEVLSVVGLAERASSPFKTYSLGMKQRLAIAGALLANPDVLILDEPTNGLDPQGIAEIRELITQIGKSGTTILLASHLLDEVEKVCDHVAVLKRGNLIYSGRVDAMGGKGPQVELAAADMEQLKNTLGMWKDVVAINPQPDKIMAQFRDEPNPAQINERLYQAGIILSHLNVRKSRLEEQFLELVSQSETNP